MRAASVLATCWVAAAWTSPFLHQLRRIAGRPDAPQPRDREPSLAAWHAAAARVPLHRILPSAWGGDPARRVDAFFGDKLLGEAIARALEGRLGELERSPSLHESGLLKNLSLTFAEASSNLLLARELERILPAHAAFETKIARGHGNRPAPGAAGGAAPGSRASHVDSPIARPASFE